ncbi:S8 family peptidase [Fluviicola sp.]|uniref:S8 family peptidase n=1 Tax=Fluviicola sp. TaxID=1917219 RepID=UPI0031D87A03
MKYLLLLTLAFTTGFLAAQTQSASNRMRWDKLVHYSATFKNGSGVSKEITDAFPVYKISGVWYVSLYGKRLPDCNWNFINDNNILLGSSVGRITTMKVPLERVHEADFSQFYSYLEIPGKIVPQLDKAVKDTRADSVQRGINLPAAFTGKDILIGVTDWGFDYGHPMFYDTLLTQSRVYAAWDQYKQAGTLPVGQTYGAEYDTPSELAAAETDTANIYSHHTHGSHVAGIAGGSGAGSIYRGFGFESEYLFVTFYIDQASAIDAFVWMKDKAQAAGKRLVVNMSWGVYYNQMGSLDGFSLLSEAIDELSATNQVVFVAAAGNNNGTNFHIKKTFNNNIFNSRIGFYSYAANPYMWGECITAWGEQGHDFSNKISVYNGAGTLLVASPFYSTSTTGYLDSMLVAGNDTIVFTISSETANPLNGKPGMQIRIRSLNTNYRIVLTGSAADGTVHYWNLPELTNGAGNFGQTFTAYGANGIAGDSYYAIGEPGCANSAITVAAYASSYVNGGGTTVGGAPASFTSIGPLHNETMKPDIAAPGVNVISSISSYTDAAYTSVASITFNNKTYDFARFSGTSMATPCVTGIVSLILDANPNLSSQQVKNIIKTTARLDNYTGAIVAPGDTKWGMGKVNAYAAVKLALNTLAVDEHEKTVSFLLYPNPASNLLHVLNLNELPVAGMSIISLDGKVINPRLEENTIDLSGLTNGMYFLNIQTESENYTLSFVKE